MIVTTQGQVVSGFIAKETPASVTARTANNILREISLDDVDDRRRMKKSFMPSGLDRTMSTQELLDLVEYLTNRR
ncbi:MAG: hypothetical protein N2C14_11850 [Planctomycetales bacterium]